MYGNLWLRSLWASTRGKKTLRADPQYGLRS